MLQPQKAVLDRSAMTRILPLLSALLVLAAPRAIRAQAQDYEFSTNADGASLTIVVYTGPGGDVIVPSTINDMPVTIIANKAFEETEVTSVTIPDTVTSLGNFAFYACSELASVTIPGSVNSIGDSAFDLCTSLGGIVIPEGVTSMGELTFTECTSLTSATIADTVTNIGNFVFYDCESLTNVTIPDSVTSIGLDAFFNCTSLGNVVIPGSVKDIGIEAFEECTSLTNLTMSEGITNIGESAFNYCISLTNVVIPDGVTSIGGEAFQSCLSLANVVIPSTVTTIGSVAFTDCTSLTNVYFQGNPPVPGSSVFSFDTHATAYYLPGTTGWKPTYAGIRTELTPIYTINVEAIPLRAGPTVSGKGRYLRGSPVTVTASFTNGCYEFVGWTSFGKLVSTDPQYTFTALKNETLMASFAWLDYEISTSSSPSNWGIVIGGGKKLCGTSDIVHAVAKPGFQFVGWTSSLGDFTKASYKFMVSGNESFVANFIDTELPTVSVTAPLANQNISTALYTIRGKTTHSTAVAAVYYNLNQTGWQPASTTDGFVTWSGEVDLFQQNINTLSAYAVDALGNNGPTNQINFLSSVAP
jgi:BspA type Leucine rich repeat region (6 copies)/Divergent InlB B-repeat domain